jgi:hypothetical protein
MGTVVRAGSGCTRSEDAVVRAERVAVAVLRDL